ncbi:MAG: L-lactate permease [Verrucomicrobiales bacterium]
MSNFHGPWLVDIVSAVVAMVVLVLFLKRWRPAEETRTRSPVEETGDPAWKAWLPWVFLTVLVFCWGLPRSKRA